jgi:DNA topoisomerase-1
MNKNKNKNNYITRKTINKKYSYYINNKKITNKKLLDKIEKIYIAPAYKNVKIFLDKKILATGFDNAGRKQYIYSDGSKKDRETKKYKKLYYLSIHINKINEKIERDLSKKEYTKEKLIAFLLKIMDKCNFRCGNKKYEKKYGSYGLTTLHKKHVSIKKDSIHINFIGKKKVLNDCIIKDKNIQNIMKDIYQLSSNKNPYLFSIKYKNNDIHITTKDINKYLKNFGITTKDLRMWNANILFLQNVKEISSNSKNKKINKKKIIKLAIEKTAKLLHHTPTICKNSYIYKGLIDVILNSNNNNTLFEKKNEKEILYTLLKKK